MRAIKPQSEKSYGHLYEVDIVSLVVCFGLLTLSGYSSFFPKFGETKKKLYDKE